MDITFESTGVEIEGTYDAMTKVKAKDVEPDHILRHMSIDDVLNHFGKGQILDHIGESEVREHFGLEEE